MPYIWAVNSAGQITINGVYDGISNGVLQLALVNGLIWQQTASGWYSSAPTNPPVYSGPVANPPWSIPITGLTAATEYDIEVQASNAAGSGPVSSPIVNVTTLSTGGGKFTVANGKITAPNGTTYFARGINVLDTDFPNVTLSLMTNLFPGCNFIRLAVGGDGSGYLSAQPNSSIISWVNMMTNNGAGPIVVEIENHDSSNTVPYTGSALTAESNWYAALASALKNNPYVWFGTMNEPGNQNGALSAQHLATYNAIRNAGCTAPLMMCLVNGNPAQDGGLPDTPSDYNGMVNVLWDQHWYNEFSSGSTNQSTVDSDLLAAGQAEIAWTTSSNPGGTIPVLVGEGGFLDYNGGDPTVEQNGGAGTDQIVTSMFTTAQAAPFVGAAVWLWAGVYSFGTSATDLVNQSNNTYTQHGTFIHSNGYM